jgi:hypothetical protein
LNETGISIEQTRARIAEALRREHAEADARLTQALAEEQRAYQRLARIEHDYTDGRLSAPNYERLSARLAEALEVSRREREQAERHASDLNATASEVSDASVTALRGVHEAILAFVADARHLDEVRLRLRQVFERFTVEDNGEASR